MVKVFPPCFMGCHGSGIMCPCTQGGWRAILVRLVGYSDRSFTRRSYIVMLGTEKVPRRPTEIFSNTPGTHLDTHCAIEK